MFGGLTTDTFRAVRFLSMVNFLLPKSSVEQLREETRMVSRNLSEFTNRGTYFRKLKTYLRRDLEACRNED